MSRSRSPAIELVEIRAVIIPVIELVEIRAVIIPVIELVEIPRPQHPGP